MSITTVTIPMGQPDAYFYGNPAVTPGNNTPYVAGNGSGTAGSDHTGLIYSHSSAPNHALGSPDVGSFIHLDQAGYNTDMVAAYGFGPYYMEAAGTLDYGPTFPDGVALSVSLTLTSRSSTTDHSFYGSFYFYDETDTQVWSTSAYFADATPGWSTFTTTPQQITNTDPTALAATLTAIKAGRMLVLVSPRYTPTYNPPTWTDDFAYLAANFSWSTGSANRVNTWVRTVQRGDQFAGAPRAVQNNSQQASLRNIGFR